MNIRGHHRDIISNTRKVMYSNAHSKLLPAQVATSTSHELGQSYGFPEHPTFCEFVSWDTKTFFSKKTIFFLVGILLK